MGNPVNQLDIPPTWHWSWGTVSHPSRGQSGAAVCLGSILNRKALEHRLKNSRLQILPCKVRNDELIDLSDGRVAEADAGPSHHLPAVSVTAAIRKAVILHYPSSLDCHCLLSPVSDALPGEVELWPVQFLQHAVVRAPHRVRWQRRSDAPRAAARHPTVVRAVLAMVVEKISGILKVT